MDKYIIMSDLDKTLLNNHSKISLKTKYYLKALMKRGHYFIMSTGRPYQGAKEFIKAIKPDIIVCDNGGSIHFLNEPDKSIFYTIDRELFKEFLKDIDEYLLYGYSSDFYNINMQESNLLPFWIKHIDKSRHVEEGRLLDILNHDPINPNLFIKKEGKDYILSLLESDKYRSMGYRLWNNNKENEILSLELFNYKATKGTALNTLKKILEVDFTHDLVFGDELNDIEMLDEAYNSICMINGNDKLKSRAKYITKYDNHHNGEIRFIKEFFKKNNIK